ncbi:MAG: hypothetical protein DRQ35_01745 [Gammaproteobacteria bacterium]|nr:MAG: hypothetical protein DRQ35_01745 [Gammaproteobacteria bacterium]
MTNYEGVRVMPRIKDTYIIEVNDRWYYYDKALTLRGSFKTKEEAIEALRNEWEQYGKEI